MLSVDLSGKISCSIARLGVVVNVPAKAPAARFTGVSSHHDKKIVEIAFVSRKSIVRHLDRICE